MKIIKSVDHSLRLIYQWKMFNTICLKGFVYRGCDKEGFEKPSKVNGLMQQQTGNVCKGHELRSCPFYLQFRTYVIQYG